MSAVATQTTVSESQPPEGTVAPPETASLPQPAPPTGLAVYDSLLDRPASGAILHDPSVVEASYSSPKLRHAGGWEATHELTLLNPSFSDTVVGVAGERLGVGSRLTVGWESEAGLGLRVRGWRFWSESPARTDGLPINEVEVQASRLDVDVVRRFAIHHGEIVVGPSVTIAGHEIELASAFSAESVGVGAGFVAEGRHRILETSASNWALFGRGRLASLVGRWKAPWRDDATPGARTEDDANTLITELAVGVEYRRRFYDRTDFVLQCALESQTWNNSFLNDLGFLGTTIGAGFDW